MKLYRSLSRKVNFEGNPFQVKVKIKYKWGSPEKLESYFNDIPNILNKMYGQIAAGEGMFITLLVEAELSDIVGSDCLGTVWIDGKYTIEDCIKENHMIKNAIQDLLKRMEKTYNSIKAVLT